MRVLIPYIRLGEISEDSLIRTMKQTLVSLCSYFYHGNAVPVTLMTDCQELRTVVGRAVKQFGWPVEFEDVDIESIDRDKYTYGHWANLTRPETTAAKLYAMHRGCRDEDRVLLVDTDTMFVSRIDLEGISTPGLTVFQPQEWRADTEVTNGWMIGIDARSRGISPDRMAAMLAKNAGVERLPDKFLGSPWANSGFTLITREYREEFLPRVIEECGKTAFIANSSGLDERIFFYLQMVGGENAARDAFSICRDLRMNVPACNYRGYPDERFSFPDGTLAFHFHSRLKPDTFTMPYDGKGYFDPSFVCYELNYPTAEYHFGCSGNISYILLTMMWQYYYTLISWCMPHGVDRYTYKADTFYNIVAEYALSRKATEKVKDWWKHGQY